MNLLWTKYLCSISSFTATEASMALARRMMPVQILLGLRIHSHSSSHDSLNDQERKKVCDTKGQLEDMTPILDAASFIFS